MDVTVTTPGGKSATSPADRFTYIVAPAVTGVSPTSGPLAGGTLVTITGSGFTRRDGGRLRHDGGDGLTVVNNTTITADSPAGTGMVDVTVTTPGGTVGHIARGSLHLHRGSGGYGREPDQRSGAGGTLVTITGSGFSGATAVDFGAIGGDGHHSGQRHQDHCRQPGGQRRRGRDRDDAGRHVGHVGRRSIHATRLRRSRA